MKKLFQVGNKPFFSLGAQVRNSTACQADRMEKVWENADKVGFNTIAAPVYWSLLEPEENHFDYTQIDMLIDGARQHHKYLTVLWFGSWKNGASQYAPLWVKRERKRFRRVKSAQGYNTMVLSPHCEENQKADAKAFATLMAHIKKADQEHVVIAVQIENEPGQIGTPRDYSEIGESAYRSDVPHEVIHWLQVECDDTAEIRKVWRERGSRKQGTWEELFGFHAAETSTAYAFARYLDVVAQTGKQEYNLPCYVNVWLGEMYNRVPGIDYPTGGATTRMIDLWKRFASHIDAICPDLYFSDFQSYDAICRTYARKDNPLYIPESGATVFNAVNTFYGVVHWGLCGVHCFGIENLFDEAGVPQEDTKEYIHMVQILSHALPLIQTYQGSDKLYAVAQYEGSAAQYFDFGDFIGRAVCTNPLGDPYSDKQRPYLDVDHQDENCYQIRGKGIIVYEGNGVFYLAGEGFRLNLIRKDTIEGMTTGVRTSNFQNLRHQEYLELSEGHFDATGRYTVDKIRTGDESDYGIWVHFDVGVVRAHLEMEREEG